MSGNIAAITIFFCYTVHYFPAQLFARRLNHVLPLGRSIPLLSKMFILMIIPLNYPTKYNSLFFTPPWRGPLKSDPHSCNLIHKPESHQLSALDQPSSIHDSYLVTPASVCLKIGYPNPSTGLCFFFRLLKKATAWGPPISRQSQISPCYFQYIYIINKYSK